MEFLDNTKNYYNEIIIKIVIVGKIETGKSFFSIRMDSKNYLEFKGMDLTYNPTIGFEYFCKKVKVKNKIFKIHIWNTCGGEIYKGIITGFYGNANLFLIFYDAFDRNSFDIAKSYLEDIKTYSNENQIGVLVRCKYENKLNFINNENIVTDEEALEYADKNDLYFFHIAIYEKYETGINELIEFILNQYIKKIII